MAVYSNGISTRDTILQTARTLFYQLGYRATTTRQLSSRSNTNLGLIKYHFNSKSDIGLAVYREISQEIAGWALSLESVTTPAQRLMLAGTAEVLLTFNSPEFCRFFNELYEEPKVRDLHMEQLHTTFASQLGKMGRQRTRFLALCLLGCKTNLVRYVSPQPDAFDPSSGFLQDHLRLQAKLFDTPDPEGTVEKCRQILARYRFQLLPEMQVEIQPLPPTAS